MADQLYHSTILSLERTLPSPTVQKCRASYPRYRAWIKSYGSPKFWPRVMSSNQQTAKDVDKS